MVDGPARHPAWRASLVAGFGLAAWTVIAVQINALFVEDVLRTFYDPQGYEQERDALRRGAVALYTAGVHVGHGLAIFVGFWLGLRQTSARATLVTTAAAGLLMAAGQAAVAATLTPQWLQRWDEGGEYSFPTTMLGDLGVLVPMIVCFMLYPLLTMLGGRLGLHSSDVGAPPWGARLNALVPWVIAGPFYLTLDFGPPAGQGWTIAAICWLVALGCLVFTLAGLSAARRTDSVPGGGASPSLRPDQGSRR